MFLTFSTAGCQVSYYLHNAYNQSRLVSARTPIPKALESKDLNEDQKRKLKLVQEVKAFAEGDLGLKSSSNYTSFVQLDSPYVTYIVQASKAYELKPYLWKFPFVGEVPYKGYFKKSMAEEEAKSFDNKLYDTYVRGVSAYSTLGWFQDSVLSSMLRYDDYDLVELIIHETIHTTLFIKNAAEFNERLATYLGREGMRLFYLKKEGETSKTLKQAAADVADQKLFSEFLTKEVESLKTWYLANKDQIDADKKQMRLKEIQERFKKELKPKLKTASYSEFEKRELNNAMLLAYRTYEYKLDDFEKLHKHLGGDFQKTMAWLKELEGKSKPDQVLKDFVTGL